MRIAIMQPTYLPWLGYFELMENCDIFVYLDDVQYVKKTFHSRNKIKAKAGELLLTVPVLSKGNFFQLLSHTRINNDINWKRKHFKSIEINYCKAPYYNKYIDGLRRVYAKEYSYLVELNVNLIEWMMKKIGIKTETMRSSQLEIDGAKDNRIVNICKILKANILYDTFGAKKVLDESYFNENNIELIFQNFNHPKYGQQWGQFISYLSALDLLMNDGPNSLEIIRSSVSK